MRVEVYRNLHNGLMSVREVGGRVLTHEYAVFLAEPTFVVRPAGRAKVLREGRKNVHAFVRGELKGFSTGQLVNYDNYEEWTPATYNPYRFETFVNKITEEPIYTAPRAVVTTQGVYVADEL